MSLSDKKRRACEEISAWLKEADIKAGNTVNSDAFYFSEAEKRIEGFRWQLYKLNRPFFWLEKKVIEPLDRWSDRANLFQFLAKVSPLLEAIGVLAIPFVLFYYENQRNEQQIKIEEQREERQLEFERERDKRQLEFEQNVIEFQAEVRQQQAVRDYLSQITTIYLDVENRDAIEQDEDLKNLLEATTLAIFDELSVSESSQDEPKDSDKLNQEYWERDRKGDVINFLSDLGWINNLDKEKSSLISLKTSNLSQSDLRGANLEGADLEGANLKRANLNRADLRDANLRGADLSNANLRAANLKGADLSYSDRNHSKWVGPGKFQLITTKDAANLEGADLRNANLEGAKLGIADLSDAIFCNTKMPDRTINNCDCE